MTQLKLLIKDLITENHLSVDEAVEQDFYDFISIMNVSKEDMIEDPRKMLQAFS